MERREFISLTTAAVVPAAAAIDRPIPDYRVVTPFQTIAGAGMPGPFPGRVVAAHSPKFVNEATDAIDTALVREALDRGMRQLTGESSTASAWKRFFTKDDVVGIKVNVVGRPKIVSTPEVLNEIIRNLTAIGVPLKNITLYDRFTDQMEEAGYHKFLPAGVKYFGAESRRGSNLAYDPEVYVETDFYGEDDTRSNLLRCVARQFTKIISVPNMKDHGAAGVTGCLKNVAYGSYSNVARSHARGTSNTYSFIGKLTAAEPLRSKVVLQVMDGLRGVWHGGPFNFQNKYRFYPKQILLGTDPVAIDRLMLDVVEAERKKHGAISLWDRNRDHLHKPGGRTFADDPNVNNFIREPGHIDFASALGLGVADVKRIQVEKIDL